MKNIFRILMAVAVLLTASCAKEDISSTIASGEANVTFTVDLPELGTRAETYGKGNHATKLQFFVYEYENDETIGKYLENVKIYNADNEATNVIESTSKRFDFSLTLIKGMRYNIVFWADKGNGSPYSPVLENGVPTGVIKANYTDVDGNAIVDANDDTLDAFFGSLKNFDPAAENAQSRARDIKLYRPFAQLNAATNDLTAVKNSGVVLNTLTSKVTVKAYTTLDLFDGDVSNPTQVTFNAAVIPAKLDTPETLKDGYDYLSMNYVLVNEKELVEATLTVYGERTTGGEAFPLTVNNYTNVPLQRNYRTNILGSLITKATEFEVTINADWEDKEKYVLAGGEVTLTENLVANNIVVKEDTVLNLNGYNVESGIEYVAGLTGTDIAAITIENGATLTIIGDGTIKGTTYGVYAKDGNLIIKGGNYIAGTSAVQVANATVNIEGGTFKTTGTDKRYVINCLDADYKAGRAVVEITGGTFEGFNPANNAAEGQGTNFVVNGYCAIESDGSFTVYKGYPIYSDDAETTIVDGVVGLEIDAENITTYGVSSANGLKWISKQIDGDLAHTAEKAYEVNGNTIKLLADIDLSESNWNPIGDNRTNAAFAGVFDGQNHKITGAHITGDHCFNGGVWALKEGWGLFSRVKDATIKNFKVDGATFGSYTVVTGTIAAYAHNTTFENIEITNTKIAGYDWYTGGVVGWATGNCTFKGINLDNTVAVGSLWDSHGQMAGGIAGGVSAKSKITIEDCNIACVLDVINDVTSNYKYYNYRVSGMIIGTTNTTEEKWMETVTASATNVTCKNVTVTYGKWMNYHYCQEYGNRGWGRVEESDYVGFGIPNEHTHSDGMQHYVCLPFDQLFGGGNNTDGRYPVRGLAEFPGVTVVYPAEYTCDLCGQQHNVQ